MEIKTLKNISDKEIIEAFNDSFSDYGVPLQLTQESFLFKMKSENIQLELSVGVFDGSKLIGFILHGFDQIQESSIVYNAGTGVRPPFRGKNLTLKMYNYIVPALQTQGIYNHKLEVLEDNYGAINLYEKVGFKVCRRLRCFKGHVTSQPNMKLELMVVRDMPWKKMSTYWEILPTWQNETNAIERTKDQHVVIGTWRQEELAGYAILHRPSGRIRQFFVHPNYRRNGIGTALLYGVGKFSTKSELNINGVDETDPGITKFIEKMGLRYFASQLEMQASFSSF